MSNEKKPIERSILDTLRGSRSARILALGATAAAGIAACTPKQEVVPAESSPSIAVEVTQQRAIDQLLDIKPANTLDVSLGDAGTMSEYLSNERSEGIRQAMKDLGKNADDILLTLDGSVVNREEEALVEEFGSEVFTYATKPIKMDGFFVKTKEFEMSNESPTDPNSGLLSSYYQLVTVGETGEPAVTFRLQEDGTISTTITNPHESGWGGAGTYVGSVSAGQKFGKGVNPVLDPREAIELDNRAIELANKYIRDAAEYVLDHPELHKK